MKGVLTVIAIVSASVMGVGVLLGAIDSTPGAAVPDSVAANLHGGCYGVSNPNCGGDYGLSGCGFQAFDTPDPVLFNYDVVGVQTRCWCAELNEQLNYECRNCYEDYVTCGSGS